MGHPVVLDTKRPSTAVNLRSPFNTSRFPSIYIVPRRHEILSTPPTSARIMAVSQSTCMHRPSLHRKFYSKFYSIKSSDST